VKQEPLAFVELTTDATNIGSQRAIMTNGGELVGTFRKPAAHGSADSLRFRIRVG
jgi:predicted acetyltransferase